MHVRSDDRSKTHNQRVLVVEMKRGVFIVVEMAVAEWLSAEEGGKDIWGGRMFSRSFAVSQYQQLGFDVTSRQ